MIGALRVLLALLVDVLWWSEPSPEELRERARRARLREAREIAVETGFSVEEVDVALQVGATRRSILEARIRNRAPSHRD